MGVPLGAGRSLTDEFERAPHDTFTLRSVMFIKIFVSNLVCFIIISLNDYPYNLR